MSIERESIAALDELTEEVRKIRKILENPLLQGASIHMAIDKAHDTTRPPELCPVCNLECLDSPLREAKDDLEELRQAAKRVIDTWPGSRLTESIQGLSDVLYPSEETYQTGCTDCGAKEGVDPHFSTCSKVKNLDKP